MAKQVAAQIAHGLLRQIHKRHDLQIRSHELHGENAQDQKNIKADGMKIMGAKTHELVY